MAASATVTTDSGQAIIESIIGTRDNIPYKAILFPLGSSLVLSVVIIIGFSIVRPRQSKIYAPKNKYQNAHLNDPDYEPPPPTLSNDLFAWFSPIINLHEKQMIVNIGLDAVTFLRMTRMLLYILCACSVYGIVLFAINIAYNLKYVDAQYRTKENIMSMFTITNVKGGWVWPALGFTYVITFTVMGFVWYNWRCMIMLRHNWFRSPQYQSKIYSRTLMITRVPKEYRSDEGLIHLMQQIKVDGIKIAHEIDCTAIGRRLGDFPHLVEQHNEAVADLEHVLVRYLKHGKLASKRPMIRKGGFMGLGGRKVDAIDYYAKQIKFLKDQVDERRSKINSLIRQERKARKGHKAVRIEGENYGFVTFKTVAEAHRIARVHGGSCRELDGACIQMAPSPKDILWQNITKDPVAINSARMLGWFLLGALFVAYAVPTFLISVFSNLSSFGKILPFLDAWRNNEQWSFNFVSGMLGPLIQVIFLFFLPIIIRRICKRQGATTRSRLDRATTARYYFINTVWMLFFLTIFGVVYQTALDLKSAVQAQKSFGDILDLLAKTLPDRITNAYVSQSNYWLTWLPVRGLLAIYDLIQLIKLVLVSFRRLMMHYTPRDIRNLTKPYLFEYHTVSVNLLFVMTVALVYAPIAPVVVFGATLVMWFSYVVYKYQLLYVYVSRSESGGRMWNVYVNRVLFATLVMQLLVIITTGLIRRRWLDCIAGAPMVFILLGFKIWMSATAEERFRYYRPTPAEAEEEQLTAMKEKPTNHSDMDRKFLHPALRHDKIWKVMVHKQQEDLARDVLSSYPWFAEKNSTMLRGVHEDNLEYNPNADQATEAGDWDARSVGSADLLSNFGDDQSIYGASPMPPHATLSKSSLAQSAVYGHQQNRSTDELLASPAPLGYGRAAASADTLLPGAQWDGSRSPSPSPHMYPQTTYGQAPVMYRTDSNDSDGRDYGRAYVEPGYVAPSYDSPASYGPSTTYPPEAPYRVGSTSPAGYPSPYDNSLPSRPTNMYDYGYGGNHGNGYNGAQR